MRSGARLAAKNCAHLFPKKTVENIRKTIEHTFKNGAAWGTKSAPAMEIRQQVTEEVKAVELKQLATMEEVTRDLIEKANDAYKKAMIAAESKGTKIKDADGKVKEIRGWEPRDFLYAADCLKTVGTLLSKLSPKETAPLAAPAKHDISKLSEKDKDEYERLRAIIEGVSDSEG